MPRLRAQDVIASGSGVQKMLITFGKEVSPRRMDIGARLPFLFAWIGAACAEAGNPSTRSNFSAWLEEPIEAAWSEIARCQ